MSTGLHKDLANEEVHTVVSWIYADEATRLAATGFTASDKFKFAYVTSPGALYYLQSHSPITWVELAAGASSLLNKVEVRIVKETSGTLAVGKAVYVSNWDTVNDRAKCELAKADSATTLPCVGIVNVEATDSTEGKALLLGILHDTDTTGLTDKAPIYLSHTTAGEVTTTPPPGPYIVQALGVVLHVDATEGHLGVNILSYRAIDYVTTPASLGTASVGTSNQSSPSSHVHAHGDQAGGSLHADATGSVDGFMSASDKTKLDGVASGATNTPLTSTAPVNVTKSAASAGSASDAARQDHKHDISTAVAGAATPGDSAAEGTATTLSRSDHQHSLPAFGTGAATFCEGNDARLSDARTPTAHATSHHSGGSDALTHDSIAGSGTNTHAQVDSHIASTANPHSVTASQAGAPPTSRTLTAGAGLTGGGDLSADRTFNAVANADGSIVVNADDIQVGVLASDSQHGTRGGGTQHSEATTGTAGFMSSSDKTKLDGVSGTNTGDEVQATETAAGIAEIATQAETDAGTDDQRIVTPAKLAAYSGLGGGGDVVGPASATDDAVARYDGTTGKLIQNSSATISDTGDLGVSGNITVGGTVDGRDVATDGAKLDGIATGATNNPLSSTAPVNVTKAAASAGSASESSRQDHKHDISTAAAVAVGTANAEGSATTLARSDHTHQVTGLTISGQAQGDILYRNASAWVRLAAGTAGQVLRTNGAAANPSWGSVSAFPEKLFQADQLESPNNANWAVNALAPLIPDASNLALSVRAFDDTAVEGVGFTARVPAGASNIVLWFLSRAATAPGSTVNVGLNLYKRAVPDNSAIPAWGSATALTNLSIPTNANYQKDTQTIALATLGLTVGVTYLFELCRNVPTDTLSGDWLLHSLTVGWS